MKNNFSRALFLIISLTSCHPDNTEVFVEAETFMDHGGWVVDPQFTEQMGSPYLLAHGLGYPVKNARININSTVNGNYYAWVRTKNWAPGNWEAPGRFELIINGQPADSTLGTGNEWAWQYAGTFRLKSSVMRIEMKDLTGFEFK